MHQHVLPSLSGPPHSRNTGGAASDVRCQHDSSFQCLILPVAVHESPHFRNRRPPSFSLV
jgi:hypothetical protein